jgi:HEAT repeat protein
LVFFLFTALWTAIIYFIRHSQAPWFFAVVFELFEILLIYGVLHAALGSCRIEVGNGKIVYRRGLLGTGATHEIGFADIAQILTVTTAQQKGAQASYSLFLYTKSGDRLTLADAIDSRQEARWVAAQLEKFAGLKLDTHVAVQAGFGASGPPPQRGQASSVSPATLRRNRPVASAVNLVLFLAWIGFMGFTGYRFFSHVHAQPKHVPRAVGPAKSALRQVSYSRLTDEDVQRLEALPEQAQAEELLDRAIQHDPRALEVFEQKIGAWRDLQRTARMNELERRSLYSTDLRVRYANADLNLALDGLPKTDEAADQLIAQAESDRAHRAYSVYHLGMLAGRGVGYDRIYPILVEYAKNDSDPQVRQWAVEGMRYLGTDEALTQLFDSFTQDPSNAVRDRAGCNVSDCGNFMRKQRMRMVPRLIELAADPRTNAQMRNWSFLALCEITDENLPDEASAWQDWYTQHGAEKLAEFERQEWWKVRGDQ